MMNTYIHIHIRTITEVCIYIYHVKKKSKCACWDICQSPKGSPSSVEGLGLEPTGAIPTSVCCNGWLEKAECPELQNPMYAVDL